MLPAQGVESMESTNATFTSRSPFASQTGEEFAIEFMRDHLLSKKNLLQARSGDLSAHINNADIKTTPSSSFQKRSLSDSTMVTETDRRISAGLDNPGNHAQSDKWSKFLCSFGGKILPRPIDGKPRYVGGETRLFRLSGVVTWSKLEAKTKSMYNQPHKIKYLIPGDDIDALITVSSDMDVRNMLEEYAMLDGGGPNYSQAYRIFLVPPTGFEHTDFGADGGATEYNYIIAINGMDEGVQNGDPGAHPPPISPSDSEFVQLINMDSEFNQPDHKHGLHYVDSRLYLLLPPEEMMNQNYPQLLSNSRQHDGSITLDNSENEVTDMRMVNSLNLLAPASPSTVLQSDGIQQELYESLNQADEDASVYMQPVSSSPSAVEVASGEPNFNQEAHQIAPAIEGSDAAVPLEDYNMSNTQQDKICIDMNSRFASVAHIFPKDKMSSAASVAKPSSKDEQSLYHDQGEAARLYQFPDVDIHNAVVAATEAIIPTEQQLDESSADQGENAEDQTDVMGTIGALVDAVPDTYHPNVQIIDNNDLEELKQLGEGAYGTVFHGKWKGTDVAIKRIKKSSFAGRPSVQQQQAIDFWREAEILSQLHHPNIVAFYGVVKDGPDGTLATVTEFMVNGSLRDALHRKLDRIRERRKRLMIACDAAMGMEYLHSKKIVHFDLKCDNLLVNLRDPSRPICKVGDLGLSKMKKNTMVTGGMRGTLPWMAPELLSGGKEDKVSDKVDVYSFGIVLWEILTGEDPYADMHQGQILGGIVSNTLRPPVPADCDPEWESLMVQCWDPDPAQRPPFTFISNRLRAMLEASHAKPPHPAATTASSATMSASSATMSAASATTSAAVGVALPK